MNKLILPAFLLVLVISCTSSDDDPKPASCQPTVIEDFNETSTFFYFKAGSVGFNVLESISVDDGTDSAYMYTYEYSGSQLSKLSSEVNGTVNYTPTYDGDKLTTYQVGLLELGLLPKKLDLPIVETM